MHLRVACVGCSSDCITGSGSSDAAAADGFTDPSNIDHRAELMVRSRHCDFGLTRYGGRGGHNGGNVKI